MSTLFSKIVEEAFEDVSTVVEDPNTLQWAYFDTLKWACFDGNISLVNLLFGVVDPSAFNNEAIRTASENGHADVVDRLLQDSRVDPSVDNNYAIRWASQNGHVAVVERILQDRRSTLQHTHIALRTAAEHNQGEIVDLVLRCGRKLSCSKLTISIRNATLCGYDTIVERLKQELAVESKSQSQSKSTKRKKLVV